MKIYVILAFNALIFGLTAVACDLPGGYANLAEPLDVIITIGSDEHTTWIRKGPQGTELLLLGGIRPDDTRRFTYTTVEKSRNTTLITGSYNLNENMEQIVLHHEMLYHITVEPNTSPMNKDGATRIELDVEEKFDMSQNGKWLILKNSTDTREFELLESVFARIDINTQEGVETLARFYQLNIVNSQVRVPGFGGAGMMQFINKPATFKGVISGRFRLNITNMFEPLTHFIYENYSDFTGMVIEGVQSNQVNMNGSGRMFDTVGFQIDAGDDILISGSVNYGEKGEDDCIELVNGDAQGGYYLLTVEGKQWEIDYEVLNNMDFDAILY